MSGEKKGRRYKSIFKKFAFVLSKKIKNKKVRRRIIQHPSRFVAEALRARNLNHIKVSLY